MHILVKFEYIALCMLPKILFLSRYGLLGKKFKDTFGHIGDSILGGLVGMKKPDNHGVPYSLQKNLSVSIDCINSYLILCI